ncbi:MAG: hypothetical protein U1E83_10910 [Methylotetracoccus sp.]
MNTLRDFRNDLNQHFGFLETDFGFSLASFTDEPAAFDDFVAVYSRDDIEIRVIRDRSQIFIAFRHEGGPWINKEPLLESLGVLPNHHPKRRERDHDELSSNYDIENQSNDLRKHFAIILQNLLREK